MKQHGLLFQPDMARANVAGLKTMTRRGNGLKRINTNPEAWRFDGWISDTTGDKKLIGCAAWSPIGNAKYDCSGHIAVKCPWQAGDLIYQKESYSEEMGGPPFGFYFYRADGVTVKTETPKSNQTFKPKWKSSLFMPKKAARFWAEIVSIKVERVRDISEADALKEGIPFTVDRPGGMAIYGIEHRSSAARAYQDLYDRINGVGRFDKDWCWVIEYREVKR